MRPLAHCQSLNKARFQVLRSTDPVKRHFLEGRSQAPQPLGICKVYDPTSTPPRKAEAARMPMRQPPQADAKHPKPVAIRPR